MGKLLYVSANPKSELESISLTVGRAFVNQFQEVNPDFEVEELNVFDLELQDIDQDVLNGWGKLRTGMPLTEIEQIKVEKIEKITEQFISADHYLFSSPLWNLGIPGRLKIYFDNVVIARKTIAYTESGLPVGLLTDRKRKALYIQAAGGFHSGEDAIHKEYASPYIKGITEFMGLEYVGTLFIEGMSASSGKGEELKKEAIEKAKEWAGKFIGETISV